MSIKLPPEIEQRLAQQETAWQEGVRISIHQLLSELPETIRREEVILELICHEVTLRERLGEVPQLAEYQEQFPDLAESIRIQWEIDRLLIEQVAIRGDVLLPDSTSQDGASRVHEQQNPTRERIGRYELRREVGRGAMGIVYEAWDPRLKRTVAVKKLRGDVDRDHIKRVVIEAESAAKIHHPHIVEIYDIGEELGQPFLAMEFCRGGNLTQHLRHGPLSPRLSAQLIAKVAAGIAKAHECRIIHRDLKPGNLLLEREDDWTPKVTDFGLAKRLDDEPDATATGMILGTPAYMAPEQADGGSKRVGSAADIYSLGAILYECLSGHPPFRGSSISETLDQVRHAQPLPIRLLQPSVPRDLETVCQRCLEKEPWRRYQSAADLADDLERYLSGRPIVARPVGMVGKAWRWSRRNPGLTALLTTISLLVTVIAVGSSIAAVWLQRESSNARSAERNAIASNEARRQELARVYLSEARAISAIDGADQRRKGSGAVRNALAAVPWREMKDDLRSDLVDAAIPCLTLAELNVVQRVPLEFVHVIGPIIDIDSDFRYWIRPDAGSNTTVLASIQNSSEVHEFRADGEHAGLPSMRGISPNGQWVFEHKADPMRLLVWNRYDGHLVLDDNQANRFTAFHPKEHQILYFDQGRRLRLFDLKHGIMVSQSPDRFREPRLAFSHDGSLVALASDDMPAEIIDPSNWQTIASLPEIGSTCAVAWHPSEPRVFFGTADGRIYSSEIAADWRTRLVSDRHSAAVDRIVVSPDARMLAASDQRAHLVISQLDGGQIVARLMGIPLRFSVDSRKVAVAGRDEVLNESHLWVFEIINSPVRQVISVADDSFARGDVDRLNTYTAAEFSLDGRWLGVSGPRGVQLYDARTLKLVADLGLDTCGPVAFEPSGKCLITFGKFSQPWIWPFSSGKTDRIGPPVPVWPDRSPGSGTLAPQHAGRQAVWSADGGKIAICDHRGSKVIVRDVGTGQDIELLNMRGPNQLALSHDGRWVAIGDRREARVTVWDTRDGSLVFGSNHIVAAFCSDKPILAVRHEGDVQLFNNGTWQLQSGFRSPSRDCVAPIPMAFQRNGHLLAVADSAKIVGLYDHRTGRRIVTLDDRDERPAEWLSFSHDGLRLAVTRPGTVAIWNLAALRNELVELGLQVGELPVRPSTDQLKSPAAQTNDLIVDRGSLLPPNEWYKLEKLLADGEVASRQWPDAIDDLNNALRQIPESEINSRADLLAQRGQCFYHNLNFAVARHDWQSSLELDPDNDVALTGLARLYILGPENLRDPRRATFLAHDLSAKPATESIGKLLTAMARVRLGETEQRDREVLDAAIASAGPLRVETDLQIFAGYFRALDLFASRNVAQSKGLLTTTNSLYGQLRDELTGVARREVDSLSTEVEQLLSGDSE